MKIIPIEGVIGWDVTEQGIRESLAAANGDEVEFHFSTPGGLIGAGLGIGAQIKNYPGKTTAVLTGYAMSMGSYLPQCCDNRVVMDDAVFMIHNARGMTWGDHNDVLKYGAYLKGLSGVIARRLSKCSGNDLPIVTDWMDAETFFFGEDIVAAGFADEMRESGKDSDKDTALATAKSAHNEAMAMMARESNTVRDDMNKAMAMNLAEEFAVQTPAATGNKKQEVQQMNLQTLLAANPEARAEFDAAIIAATATGQKAGSDAMASTIKKVSPFLTSNEYPEIIKTTALSVLTGEGEMSTLTAAVAAVDAVKQMTATAAAVQVTTAVGESKGEQTEPVDLSKPVATDAQLDAAVAAMGV